MHRLVGHFGAPEAVFAAGSGPLQAVLGPRSRLPAQIAAGQPAPEVVEQELEDVERAGCRLLCLHDEEYPSLLRRAATPPPLLYVKGRLEPRDERSVALVGSRTQSQYGKEAARVFADGLARLGLTVISGFARGIDTPAHRAALEAGGRTLAVLGNGLGRCYPPENRGLADEIAAAGALISTFPMRTGPEQYNFPERNYYIACLAPATLVIEAGEQSGALITAGCALDEGRLVFAVPGDIFRTNARGTNALIRQGAILAQSPADLIEDLAAQWPGWTRPDARPAGAASPPCGASAQVLERLSDEEKEILDLVGHHSQSLEQIVQYFEERGQSFGQVTLWLLNLQMHRLIRQLPGNQYIRAAVDDPPKRTSDVSPEAPE
ncbi:MAG: DNA-processing protein DprA [Candidatus Sumerlaeia bacterium]